MRWLIFLFLTMFGCTETGIVKHTVEEKYIYPSYYDVYVEDSGLVIEDTADEEQFPVWVDSFELGGAPKGNKKSWDSGC